jgi:glycosyltransferase involved in cell wall biosynthesis
MITVVLPTHNSAARLVHLLPLLVPAAVDGLVKAVVFADAGSTDATLDIAEDSGARVVQAPGRCLGARLAAGCAAVRSAWILALGEDPDPAGSLAHAGRGPPGGRRRQTCLDRLAGPPGPGGASVGGASRHATPSRRRRLQGGR